MGELTDICACTEHAVSELICIYCVTRWVAVRPSSTKLKEIECPKCGHIGGVIETGQEIEIEVEE